MERITPDQLSLLKDRFGNFHDSVIHSISLGLFSDRGKASQTISFIIGAPDLKATTSSTLYNFVNIEFKLVGVESFALIKAWNYNLSVLFHLDIHIHRDKIYFVDAETPPEDLAFEDFINPSSSLFLAAQEAYYKISPYQIREF